MTDDKLNEAISRGARAERLLDDDLLQEAFDALERDYVRGWRDTGARDTDARERLWQALHIVAKVRAHLVAAVSNGKLAQPELDDLAQGGRKRFFGVV
jgi:hypothetical protein